MVGRLPWSSNLTFLVTLDASGADPVCAVYKPARGERSLWDFPDGLYRREVAAFELSEALGWGLVPPPWPVTTAPSAPAPSNCSSRPITTSTTSPCIDEGHDEDALRTICAFDIVANNADRKSGHVLRGPDGRLWAIDHGLCFHRHPKLRTVIWDFADEHAERRDDRRPRTAGLGGARTMWACSSRNRSGRRSGNAAAHLIDARSFPEPDGDRPPYPWPLV